MKILCAPRGSLGGAAAVYALLERAFRREYGSSLPEVKKTPNGKPYFPDMPDIHFSLSHSHTHVLCAVGLNQVGVDIESPRDISGRVVEYFSSPAELALFDPLELWVLKESYIKLIGSTLLSMKHISFSREGARIVAPDDRAAAGLYRVDGCTAAVSVFGEEPPDDIELISLSP